MTDEESTWRLAEANRLLLSRDVILIGTYSSWTSVATAVAFCVGSESAVLEVNLLLRLLLLKRVVVVGASTSICETVVVFVTVESASPDDVTGTSESTSELLVANRSLEVVVSRVDLLDTNRLLAERGETISSNR